MSKSWAWAAVAAVVVGTVAWIGGSALAGDAAAPKVVDQNPLIKALVGTWDCSTKGDGAAVIGWRAYRMAAAGTCVVEDCETSAEPKFSSHSVWRLNPDGKTLTCSWWDNQNQDAVVLTGTISDTAVDLNAKSAGGGRRTLITKAGDGFDLTVWRNGQVVLTGTYKNRKP